MRYIANITVNIIAETPQKALEQCDLITSALNDRLDVNAETENLFEKPFGKLELKELNINKLKQ